MDVLLLSRFQDEDAACRVLQLTEELIPFGVTAAKLRDVLRGKRLQGSKAIQTAAGNVADKGMLKAWNQSQVDELIQLMVQQKVLREEKEKVGGQKGAGKGKGWKAPKRLREAANAAKLRNGDLTLLMSNCPKASAPEATEDLGTPPATESGEAQDPASPAPKRKRLRKVKDVPMESEAAAPIVEDLDQQLVACEVPDPEDPAAEQESGPKDEKVPDSKRFQSLFGASRKSTNRQSKAKATRRRSSLNKQDEDKEEEGWPPVPSDSSGDELVWIGGGQRPSPVRRHRPSAACPEPPREPLEPLQQEPVQATSPGRRLPWQSNAVPSQPLLQQAPELPQTSEPQAVPSQPPLQQAPELPQTSEPQATSPGRRLPWQSNVAPAPPPMSAPPGGPSGPSRAARRNQLRVST
ncbi:unnamed protein product [Cladocopium goreaui]|uniref:Mediator of RNA polymerase II transcription subunit 34 n=1 Tax=Cladocopium goreaui TaxID=2562237 RepID=A0A9P1GKV4_9DINO|nr:unnamed protein product [Cladocopium goreaui]